MKIQVYDRRTRTLFDEQVYGEKALRWVYGTLPGRLIESSLLSRHWVSRLMGAYYSSDLSAPQVRKFIQQYQIDESEFEPGPFDDFNSFFIRRFAPGKRSFVQGAEMAAPAEARYFAWSESSEELRLPVKGAWLSPSELLADCHEASYRQRLLGGPVLLARLCPVDYHRFHFPDRGEWLSLHRIHGRLRSVNPVALGAFPRTFLENERQVSWLKTERFGLLAYIEVGALGVGRIRQTHAPGSSFERGDEKGYFLFGGSTVIVLGEPGKWKPSSDLLEHTEGGHETRVRLGEAVASLPVS
jgi:phosphatidylserine decarboxylase